MEHRPLHVAIRKPPKRVLLEREIVEITRREKERIGRELHDGLCQSLAGIAALSSTLSRDLAANADPAASATAGEIARLLNEAIGQARDLARGLGAVGLDAAGLAEALQTLAGNVRHLFHVSCTLTCDRLFPSLSGEAESHLYRIAQEAVHNAIVHGRAEHIDIGLTCADGKGVLTVRDNGTGLPDGVGSSHGIGLRTMDYRAHEIHGCLKVCRQSPRGTVVTCVFRLPKDCDSRERLSHPLKHS